MSLPAPDGQGELTTPLRLIGASAVVTAVLAVVAGWLALVGSREAIDALEHLASLEQAASDVRYFDEVLTMSALMGTTTGLVEWEERYRESEAALDSAFAEALGIASLTLTQRAGVSRASAANVQLVELENRAFSLVREGNSEQARELLQGTEYGDLKSEYAAGIGVLEAALQAESRGLVEREIARRRVLVTSGLSAMAVLLLSWGGTYRLARRWSAVDAEHRLALGEKAEELEQVNAGLEARVRERTRRLEESRTALLNMMEDTSTAVERLKRSEASYASIFEKSSLAILRVSTGGTLVTANPATVQLLGYTDEAEVELLNMATDVCSEPSEFSDFIDQCRRDGLAIRDIRWKRRDGQDRSVRVRASFVEVEDDEDQLEMIAEDVTDREKVEAQLRQAQKMEAVGQLTGGIAHDFNNLLSVIMSNTELARGLTTDSADAMTGLLDEILQAARRGAAVVRRLLGFSRHSPLVPRPVDISEIVTGFSQVLKRLIPESIHFEVTVEEGLPAVVVDPTSVEQILLNLVANARDAMPDGGTLSVAIASRMLDAEYVREHPWARDGPHVSLSVNDTGVGMDAETRKNIFTPFFTTKGPGGGTGLGMAMVYGLVRQQGGFVQIYSEVGEGTNVTTYFPATQQLATGYEPKSEPSQVGGGTETILLVEDEPALARAATRVLKKHGYTVVEASNGVEALEIYGARDGPIDLVLSDWVMPEMGGRELARRLRLRSDRPRILFASGYSLGDDAERNGITTEQHVLKKPWTIAELLKAVRDALDAPTGDAGD